MANKCRVLFGKNTVKASGIQDGFSCTTKDWLLLEVGEVGAHNKVTAKSDYYKEFTYLAGLEQISRDSAGK